MTVVMKICIYALAMVHVGIAERNEKKHRTLEEDRDTKVSSDTDRLSELSEQMAALQTQFAEIKRMITKTDLSEQVVALNAQLVELKQTMEKDRMVETGKMEQQKASNPAVIKVVKLIQKGSAQQINVAHAKRNEQQSFMCAMDLGQNVKRTGTDLCGGVTFDSAVGNVNIIDLGTLQEFKCAGEYRYIQGQSSRYPQFGTTGFCCECIDQTKTVDSTAKKFYAEGPDGKLWWVFDNFRVVVEGEISTNTVCADHDANVNNCLNFVFPDHCDQTRQREDQCKPR